MVIITPKTILNEKGGYRFWQVILLFWLRQKVVPYTKYKIQARNQGGLRKAKPPLQHFSPSPEKCVGLSLKNLDPSQKTLRPTWCPKLVASLTKSRSNYYYFIGSSRGPRKMANDPNGVAPPGWKPLVLTIKDQNVFASINNCFKWAVLQNMFWH